RNQTEFAAARTGERSASTRATLRAVDPVEEAEKTKTCAVENVIPGTSKEVRGFVENVNRISATEVVEQERMNKSGVVIEQKHHKFNYVAEIQESRPGILNMDEYRDGSPGQKWFPGRAFNRGNHVAGADFPSLPCERVRNDLRGLGAMARPAGVESALRAKTRSTGADECIARRRRGLSHLAEGHGLD